MTTLLSARNRALLGGIVWLVLAATWRPSPLAPATAALVLLLSPLVLVPLLLELIVRGAPQSITDAWLI